MISEKLLLTIWGRELPIKIEYDCFDGEEITQIQKETLQKFLKKQTSIFKEAYNLLQKFCLQKYPEYFSGQFDNIFKYIKPNILYIKKASTRLCGLLCNFKYEQEHGLAIIIENEKVVKVDNQDALL